VFSLIYRAMRKLNSSQPWAQSGIQPKFSSGCPVAGLIGIIFGLGLGWSGMTDPERVRGFLDVTGAWDPSLIFVMGSAIPIYFIFWQIVKRRRRPLFDTKLHVPTRKDIDLKLIVGSGIFGIGWGLAGICPGPGIAGIGALSKGAGVFIAASFGGAKIMDMINRRGAVSPSSSSSKSSGVA
jgi:uncharacterized protein